MLKIGGFSCLGSAFTLFWQPDFGLKPANAAYGGLLPYEPEADLRDVVVGIAGKIDINQDWMAIAAIEHKQLSGDAAASPLPKELTTPPVTKIYFMK